MITKVKLFCSNYKTVIVNDEKFDKNYGLKNELLTIYLN